MIFRYLLAFVFILLFKAGFAQVSSDQGRFTIPHEKACAPYGSSGEIVINVPECDGSLACAIDFKYDPSRPFGDDPPGEDNVEPITHNQVVNYTYTEPGTYTIAILFGAGTGDIDHVIFTVLPGSAPEFNLFTCSNNSIQVELTDTRFDDYVIDYDQDNVMDDQSGPGLVNPPMTYSPAVTSATVAVRPNFINCITATQSATLIPNTINNNQGISRLEVDDAGQIDLTFTNTQPHVLYQLQRSPAGAASFTNLSLVTNISEFKDETVNGNQNFFCYRLGPIDVCSSPVPDFSNTNTICSVFPALTTGDGFMNIGWNTSVAGATELILQKNNSSIDPGLASGGTYHDENINCGTEYCYQFVMRYGAFESISRSLCGTATSSQAPPPIEEITTLVEGNSVEVSWLPLENFTVSKYDLFRQPTNVALPLTSVTDPVYTDAAYTPFNEVCYRVRFDDVCNNRSAQSELVCPVELTATLNADNTISLTWNAYAGYASGVSSYVVEKIDASGNTLSQTDVGTQTSFVDNTSDEGQTFSYRILTYSNSADVTTPSTSNIQTIIKSPRLWNPTAFMPEGQHEENRMFTVKGIRDYITSYELRIFNRWGQLMYYSTDMDSGWDGTFKGVRMPEGTYVFKTRIIDTAGRTFENSGTVVLFRKQ